MDLIERGSSYRPARSLLLNRAFGEVAALQLSQSTRGWS